ATHRTEKRLDSIDKSLRDRAFRLLHAITREAEARGHSVGLPGRSVHGYVEDSSRLIGAGMGRHDAGLARCPGRSLTAKGPRRTAALTDTWSVSNKRCFSTPRGSWTAIRPYVMKITMRGDGVVV